MNEEELFCKLFPEYVVNGKPLSPYFDLFESGYEQAENRYEGLEEKLKHAEENCINKTCVVFKDKEDCVAELLKLEKENAELKAELKAIDEAGEHARKQITESFRNKKPYWELEKENAELKEKLNIQERVNKEMISTALDRNLKQLTKAKELLKWFVMASVYFNGKEADLVEEAEQFLKECK